MGIVFRAKDEKSGRTVHIRIVSPPLLSEVGLEELERRVDEAKALQGRGVARVYGARTDGEARYIVSEWVPGQALAEIALAKRRDGKRFPAMGAYNIVGNILLALHNAHDCGKHHGDLRPENVFIDRRGRVKVADFSVGALFAGSRMAADGRSPYDLPDEPLGWRADLRNATLLFAELFTGLPAPDAVAALPPALQAVVEPWQAHDPSGRPDTDAATLRGELQRAVKEAKAESQGVAGQLPELVIASPDEPDEPEEDTIEDVTLIPLAPAPPTPPPEALFPASEMPPPGKSAALFRDVLEKLGAPREDVEEQWLAQKDGLDYGPFSTEELMQRVRNLEFDEATSIQQLSTGRKGSLHEFDVLEKPLARFFAERKARSAVEQAERAARVQTAKWAGKGMFVLSFVGGSIVIGILAWVFLHTPFPKKLDYSEVTLSLGGPLEEPKLDPVEELAQARFQAVKKRRKKARKRAMLKVVDTYGAGNSDDEISRIELKADSDGAEDAAGWDQAKVDRVLSRAQGRLGKCMRKELKRNPKVGSVTLSFKVAPSGAAKNVKLQGRSTKLLGKCMVETVKSLKFPKFDGFDRTVTLPFDVAR